MKIPRSLFPTIHTHLKESQKGIVIYGSRQVGKTTLVNDVLRELRYKALFINGDQRGPWWEALASRELSKLTLLITGYDIVFVDEAQRIPEIGLILKIILDNFKHIKVIVTGSSSLDLASKVSEPLTGRVYSYKLFPISQKELASTKTPYELREGLDERLIYGSYPEVFSIKSAAQKSVFLRNLADGYLYKDLLEFGDIRNSTKIYDLLRLLAFQIGSQVSLTELAASLQLNRSTVEHYIDLLEKSFIIFRLPGFGRNLRKEMTKMDKIYFYDTGIRNALVGNFSLLNARDDAGQLWENFLVTERIKRQSYAGVICSHYFWRLSSGAELDLVEEEHGELTGFEFKYGARVARAPKNWLTTYPEAKFTSVNRDTFLPFVL